MRQNKKTFSHLSLQDAKSIQPILKSIEKGIANGVMTFSDEDGEIILKPEGLLRFKVSASESETKHQLNIKISWNINDPKLDDKSILSVSSGNAKK
ncbi:MAG: amphi-Trp domain-containing protein [gamma proteobacterium symbiont of Bathyaustriella thionipta]|nr:amphi-Trp domain-containing protein [gamma proteobacterium symbiont of Bathyaustriella thionipta]MCU7950682.1 amphi-Trp domain-containing protein [gamma proteobacterium symbiont of Bathyaustriella thionipta]MCU7952600.1 amphi-Trp domain-containing protein [gamma proteobacterium symbiont of Bathyaustriella thionipta]MCU7957184.1 amphi-Trp domain-containing protein [gamma proteobacterium symbiont of Bathyaustriella thionipta]MCU7968059.1 amphi-Trp domain-containing protein [gamma proteobacteri